MAEWRYESVKHKRLATQRRLRRLMVAVSGPAHFLKGQAALAQLVEHIIRNDGVACSSHASGTAPLCVRVRRGLKKSLKSAKKLGDSFSHVRRCTRQ